MRAIILAAGIGWRLGGGHEQPPKCLLRFDGETLLERHVAALVAAGVRELHVGVGYRAADIEAEIARLRPPIPVHVVHNPDYREGNVVTLHTLRDAMTGGGDVLLMDADVLYHADVLHRLAGSGYANCFLLDRGFEPGDEPVKLCVAGGRLVEFGKSIPAHVEFDLCGESVGFFKLGATMAERLAERAAQYVHRGQRDAFYEDVLRDLLLEAPEAFGFEDVTGVPWIEIDFQEDVQRAEREVMAHIRAREAA
jgi:choline kinase